MLGQGLLLVFGIGAVLVLFFLPQILFKFEQWADKQIDRLENKGK